MQEAEITSMAEVWADPAAMTDSDIEAELGEVAVKLTDLQAAGSKIGELEARQWRLGFERKFRQQQNKEENANADQHGTYRSNV
jgi:urease alpha subunit